MRLLLSFAIFIYCTSCISAKKNYNPNKKYSSAALQRDYTLLRKILEAKHPSLYWYTNQDSMNKYFDKYYNKITDSMTESNFAWQILAPVIDKIKCGHTSVGMSSAYNKWVKHKRFNCFPFYVKVWNDTIVVTNSLNKNYTLNNKIITSINGIANKELIQNIFNYLPQDGNSENVNYLRLSSNFPYFHRNIYGLSNSYKISYLDSLNHETTIYVPLYKQPIDTNKIIHSIKPKQILTKKERRKNILNSKREIIIDSVTSTATITLNEFGNGRLRRFFRKSFHKIKSENIQNVILDLRNNGGGKVGLSTLLTRYVTRKKFKIADTLFSKTQTLYPFTKYIKGKWLNNIALFFSTHKKADGKYHFGHFERKYFYPKRKNHFDGKLFVLINGSTFSASTLFCNAVKGQQGITLIGEEAGGGWHGNNGIYIPDIVLPNTKLKVRLPLLRLVQYNHVPQNGLGVMPDLYVPTSYEALKNSIDKKMQVVKQIIFDKK